MNGRGRHRDPASRVQERLDQRMRQHRERGERIQERMERIRDGIIERQQAHQGRENPQTGRERILEQAHALFLDRGYAEVSMQQIADASGLRKASIYHHFRDKDELFAEIVLRAMQAMRHTIEGYIALGGTLPELLERLAFAQFSQMSGNTARMARDFREHIPESRHDEIHGELVRLIKLFYGVFERAAEAGEIQGLDPRIAAGSFFHTLMAWSMNFYDDVDISEIEPRALAKMAVNVILFGIASPALRQQQPGPTE
jgi:AcrR family transcriptional regulator